MRKEADKIPQLSGEKWVMVPGFNADIPYPSSRKKQQQTYDVVTRLVA